MAAVFRTAARLTQKAQYTDDYANNNEKVKALILLFEAWLKACKKYLSCLDDFCVQSISLNNYFLEWSDVSATKFPTLSSVISEIETVNKRIQNERNNVKWRYTKDLVEPLETFVTTDMNTARRLKDEFRAIQLQMQTAERFLEDLKKDKNSHRKPGDCLSAESSLADKQKEAERRFALSDLQIKDVLIRKEFELAEHFLALLEAESAIVVSATKELDTFQSALDTAVDRSIALIQEAQEASLVRNQAFKDRLVDRYESRWHELVRMISSPDLILVQSICSTAGSDSDKVLEVVIRILDAHHETLPLIKVGIQKETEGTTSEGSLFRGNSTATKLMSAFTRLTGRNYLQSTLRDLLHHVQKNPGGYEVDPSKAKDEDVAANMTNLLDTSELFLQTIMDSLPSCPPAFRYMARILRNEVCSKFPDARYSSVGGFLFLRFFCPAILAPESCGLALSGTPDAKARRPLILIAKVLQNLANNVRFGGKEAFMAPVNEFIDLHLPRLNDFFDVVVDVDEETASEYPPLTNLDEVEAVHLPDIFKRLAENLDAVVKSLVAWKNADAIPRLLELLANLTVIIEDPPKSFDTILPTFEVPLSAPYLQDSWDFSQYKPKSGSGISSSRASTSISSSPYPSSSSSSTFTSPPMSTSSSFTSLASPSPSLLPSRDSSFDISSLTSPDSPSMSGAPRRGAPRINSVRVGGAPMLASPPTLPKRTTSTVFASPVGFSPDSPSYPATLSPRSSVPSSSAFAAASSSSTYTPQYEDAAPVPIPVLPPRATPPAYVRSASHSSVPSSTPILPPRPSRPAMSTNLPASPPSIPARSEAQAPLPRGFPPFRGGRGVPRGNS